MTRLRGLSRGLAGRSSALALALVVCGCVTRTETDAPPPTPSQQLEQARLLFRAGDYAGAAPLAEKALAAARPGGDGETALFLAAESHYRLGEFERALEQFAALRERYPFGHAGDVLPERFWRIGTGLLAAPPESFGGIYRDHRPAITALSLLVIHYPRHPWADDAWLLLADAHRAEHRFDLAAEALERLIQAYPDSELRDEALYRAALCYRDATRGPGFDADPLLLAHAAAHRYLRLEPDGRYTTAVTRLVARLEQEVTEGELQRAAFYRARGEGEAERLHLANAAARFPDAEAADDARGRLARFGDSTAASVDVLRPRAVRPRWKQRATAIPWFEVFDPLPSPLLSGVESARDDGDLVSPAAPVPPAPSDANEPGVDP